MTIREERGGDTASIRSITDAAFAGLPFASGTEAAIVDALRRDGDLILSLVAERDDAVVGHIAFSPVTVGGQPGAVGLGPVSVRPDLQRMGIGSRMIEAGLEAMRERGADACVLIGNPDYYGRFGFEAVGLSYKDVPSASVQGVALAGTVPTGEIVFAPGFDAR